MGKVDLKLTNSALTMPDGSHESMLSMFYSRIVSSDFVQKIGETFVTRIFLIGIGLATSVIVARALGPEGRGLFAVAATIGAIGVQFGNLGLHASNTYYVARDRTILPALIGNTIVVSFVFGGLGIGLTWMTFVFCQELAPVHGSLLILSLIWIPLGLAYMLLQNLLIGIQHVRAYNKIELTTKILGVGLIGFIVFLNKATVEKVFLAGLVALFISFLWAFWYLLRETPNFPKPSFVLFKENIRYGLKAYLAAFFAFLVLRLDLLIVKYILGSEQTGYYAVAVNMAEMINTLPIIVGTILFPRLSAMSSDQERWDFARLVAKWVGLMVLFIAGVVALVAKPMVALLYGRSFLPAVPALAWLMPGIVMLSINTIYMNYFASTGMPPITVYSPGAAAFLNVLLNIKLIPSLGIVGAAVASTVAYGMMLAISLVYLTKLRSVP